MEIRTKKALRNLRITYRPLEPSQSSFGCHRVSISHKGEEHRGATSLGTSLCVVCSREPSLYIGTNAPIRTDDKTFSRGSRTGQRAMDVSKLNSHPPSSRSLEVEKDEDHILAALAHQDSQREDNQIDPFAERALVRKLDWILLPLFIVICKFES